jgi:phosphomethylpyrimidine synthase
VGTARPQIGIFRQISLGDEPSPPLHELALPPVGGAGFAMAKTTRIAHSCPMKIAEDVRIYAAEQGIAEEEALKKGMEAKSKEFLEKGAEDYAKA